MIPNVYDEEILFRLSNAYDIDEFRIMKNYVRTLPEREINHALEVMYEQKVFRKIKDFITR